MKVLLVRDKLDGWSAHNRCKAMQRNIQGIEFGIINGVRNDEGIREIADEYDFVHFQYTGGLTSYHYDFVMENPKSCLITIINERSVLNGVECDIPKFDEMAHACAGGTSVNKKMALMYNFDFIPNAIDFKVFHDEHNVCVGYVGTDRPNKNLHLLRDVCQDLNLNLLEVLHGLKQIPKEKMWEQYRKMDVFVHPSLTEGCSNPVLEALAMNVPVIMTKQGIWEDLDGWVTFIEPTYQDLYRELKRFKSRVMIKEKYSWDVIAERWIRFYNRKYEVKNAGL